MYYEYRIKMLSTLKYHGFAVILWRKNNILFLFAVDLLMLSNNNYVKAAAQNCIVNMTKPGNQLIADCTELELEKVPSNLDPKIQILDLSRNSLMPLDSKTFSKYTELVELRMSYLFYDPEGTPPKATPDTFQPLHKLETLIMDNAIYEGVKFQWPSLLKRLSFNSNLKKEFDASSLKALQNLSLSENLLNTLPHVHKSAPLTHLYLAQNPLNNVTAESLANLCLLEYLSMEYSDTSDINTDESHYCQCLRLEKWIQQQNISGTESLECLAPSNPKCDMEFAEASANHDKCLLHHGKSVNKRTGSSSLKWLLLIVLVMATVLIAILGFVIYRNYSTEKSQLPMESATSTSSESSKIDNAEAEESHQKEEEHDETDEDQDEKDEEYDESNENNEEDEEYDEPNEKEEDEEYDETNEKHEEDEE